MDWHGGRFLAAQQYKSPNFEARPENTEIDLVVIHNISLPPFEYGQGAIADLFLNQIKPEQHPFFSILTNFRVSSHFVIERTGQISQFVSCDDIAYHAGVSSFQGREKCNQFSIGIELEGCDFEPFTEEQYQNLIMLLQQLKQHYPIKAITGHEHIAPNRKTDPGHFFDWLRLKKVGFVDEIN